MLRYDESSGDVGSYTISEVVDDLGGGSADLMSAPPPAANDEPPVVYPEIFTPPVIPQDVNQFNQNPMLINDIDNTAVTVAQPIQTLEVISPAVQEMNTSLSPNYSLAGESIPSALVSQPFKMKLWHWLLLAASAAFAAYLIFKNSNNSKKYY